MHDAFWKGFEKFAKPSLGATLDYAAIRAAEIAKKRALPPKAINYAAMPKVLPKPVARAAPALASTPEQILKERQKTVSRGGFGHSMWQDAVKG